MHLLLIGLSHRVAEVELREKAALDRAQVASVLDRLQARPEVSGALALATCGRTEVYVTGPHLSGLEAAVRAVLDGIHPEGYPRYAGSLYTHADRAAAQHLFTVAAGLDSILVGESEILGQVRSALAAAREQGSLDTLLGQTADRAIAAARRARRESQSGHRLPSVAVAVASYLAGSGIRVEQARTVLVGSGLVAEAVASEVGPRVAGLVILSRTPARATSLALRHGANAHPFEEMATLIAGSDLAIFATSARRVCLEPSQVAGRPLDRPLVILDLGVPRNVDPAVGELPGVTLAGVDELSRSATGRRGQVAERGEEKLRLRSTAVLEAEVESWSEWFAMESLGTTLSEVARYADGIRQVELDRALKGLDLDPRARRRLETLSKALVAKLLIHPISYLRANPEDQQAKDLIERIFSRPPDSRWS